MISFASAAAQKDRICAPSGAAILHYALEPDGRLLWIQWTGNSSVEEMVIGLKGTTSLIEQLGCVAVFCDVTRNETDWSELIPLFLYEELPRAIDAGLRYLAHVTSMDPNNAMAQHLFHEAVKDQPLRVELFDDLERARQWMADCLRFSQPEGQDTRFSASEGTNLGQSQAEQGGGALEAA